MLRRSSLLPLALVVVSAFVGANSAAARVTSTDLTCRALQQVIEKSGAVIVYTSKDTYERAVSDPSHCVISEQLAPFIAPTRDNPQCLAGHYCSTHQGRPKN